MWNRVFLLAAGVASGWTLVHLLTVPPGQVPTHRTRLILGLTIGLGQVIFLATASLEAALAGLFVFAASALVAYASNAKQVSRIADAILPRRPTPAPESDPRTVVQLAIAGEPAAYEGPQHWAQAYRRRQERGESIPHWFMRPLAYARIRAAYAATGGRHPLGVTLSQAAEALRASLGPPYAVRHAYLRSEPYLVRALVALGDEGFRRVIVVPLGMLDDSDASLRQAVADSRIREIGVQVIYTPSPAELPGQADLYGDHLSLLDHGQPVLTEPRVTDDQVQSLARLVQGAEKGWVGRQA